MGSSSPQGARREGSPIGRQDRSLRTQVRMLIAGKITNGELLPGDVVRESDLCQSLGVSRTPVREAMIELCSARMLTAVPHKGFVVRERSRKEKQDVYDILAVLDAQAAVSAMERMTEEDLDALRELADFIDVAVRHRNYSEYCRLQQSFHDRYRHKSGNELLMQMFQELEDRFVMPTYLSTDKGALFQVYAQMNVEHRRIIELFAQHNREDLFRFLAFTHWRTQFDDMI